METFVFLIFCDYKEESGFSVDRDIYIQEYLFENKKKNFIFNGDGIIGNGNGNGDAISFGHGFGLGYGDAKIFVSEIFGDGCGGGDYWKSYEPDIKNIMGTGCGDY